MEEWGQTGEGIGKRHSDRELVERAREAREPESQRAREPNEAQRGRSERQERKGKKERNVRVPYKVQSNSAWPAAGPRKSRQMGACAEWLLLVSFLQRPGVDASQTGKEHSAQIPLLATAFNGSTQPSYFVLS